VDDTLFRGQSSCAADGIAAPTICVGEARGILKGVAAAVEIFRQPDYRRDRARAYRVLIDGEEVGKVIRANVSSSPCAQDCTP
jgi:hypothetical protein